MKPDEMMWKYSSIFMKRFKEEVADGKILCRDIAGVNWRDQEQVKKFHEGDKFRSCQILTGNTARIMGEILERSLLKDLVDYQDGSIISKEVISLEVTVEIISVRVLPRDLPILHLKSRNLSMGGICLETKSLEVDGVNLLSGPPFARENRLQMSFELIPKEPPFEAIGEVLWYDISRDIPEFICRLGVTFRKIKNDGKDFPDTSGLPPGHPPRPGRIHCN